MKMRLMGQLILTKWIELCALAGFKVVSVNTDGGEAIVPRDREREYLNIVKEVEQLFNLEFEHEIYKAIHYYNINNYIAESQNGMVKQKGLFVYNKPLGDGVDFLVIPKALEAYYIRGINPEKFVREHTDIHDFCGSKKIGKKFQVWWNGQKQQQLNRFYISNKGSFLYRKDPNNGSYQHILKESGVSLLNNVSEQFPKDINYNWYISKVNKIIKEIEPGQLKLF